MVVEGMAAAGHQVQHIDCRPASKLQVEGQVEAELAVVAEAELEDVEAQVDPGSGPAAVGDLGRGAKSRPMRWQRRLAFCELG